MTRAFSITPPAPRRWRSWPAPAAGSMPPVVEGAAGDCRLQDRGRRAATQARRYRRSRRGRPRRSPESVTASASAERRRRRLRPAEHAVAVDVGVDDGGDAGVLEAAGEVDGGGYLVASAQPLDGDTAAARIDADGDAAGTCVVPRVTSPGSRTATVPRMTRATPLLEPGVDAGHGRGCRRRAGPGLSTAGKDRLDRRAVHRAAGEGAVEINHMQPLEARRRRRRWAWAAGSCVEDGGARPSRPSRGARTGRP